MVTGGWWCHTDFSFYEIFILLANSENAGKFEDAFEKGKRLTQLTDADKEEERDEEDVEEEEDQAGGNEENADETDIKSPISLINWKLQTRRRLMYQTIKNILMKCNKNFFLKIGWSANSTNSAFHVETIIATHKASFSHYPPFN